MEENYIIEIWDVLLEFIPEKNRDQAATQYIEYLLTNHVDIDDLQEVTGNDDHLDTAIEEAAANLQEDDEYYEED
jgi:hypothetical protein